MCSCKIQHRESSTGNDQQTSRCQKWSIFGSIYNIHIAVIHLLLSTKYWHPPTLMQQYNRTTIVYLLCGFILLQTQRFFFFCFSPPVGMIQLKAEISNQCVMSLKRIFGSALEKEIEENKHISRTIIHNWGQLKKKKSWQIFGTYRMSPLFVPLDPDFLPVAPQNNTHGRVGQ